MPKIQLKLVLALSALVLIVVALTGVLAERGLRRRTTDQIERSLTERALLVGELVGARPLEAARSAELDSVADRAARSANARVTLIADDGSVVGDSDVEAARLTSVENHADRPEVSDALAGRIGVSSRRSATVKRDLLYVAIPARRPGTTAASGAVRLAVDLPEVEAAVSELRRELLVAGAFGIAAAFVLSFVFARLTVRPLRELHDAVASIARGELDRRLHWRSMDELGEIGGSINRLAEQLRARLEETTQGKEQLETVLGSMVDGVLVIDADDRISLANPRLRELLSVWGEVEGRPWYELIRDPAAERALRDAMQTRELVACELEGVGDGDRVLLLHATCFPSEGPRAGTIAVFHDLTEMRRLDNVRRDFIANASHELKTPLTAIRGFADTLIDNPLEGDELKRYVEIIASNAARMSNLVEDLLTLSRIESLTNRLQPTNVDVRDVAEILLVDQGPRMAAAGIESRIHTSGSTVALADRQAVEQVLNNLLDNAVKYTESGGQVDVRIEESGRCIRVTVEDTGPGIPEADQSRIFERFYRVDAARSRALGGTGLGLSIVKNLVHTLGGEVRVESEPGQGSKFVFTLPRP